MANAELDPNKKKTEQLNELYNNWASLAEEIYNGATVEQRAQIGGFAIAGTEYIEDDIVTETDPANLTEALFDVAKNELAPVIGGIALLGASSEIKMVSVANVVLEGPPENNEISDAERAELQILRDKMEKTTQEIVQASNMAA